MTGAASSRKARTVSMMAWSCDAPCFTSVCTCDKNACRLSATALLSTKVACAALADDPTARNSKRLPVKANGEVRLRSVLSGIISGSELIRSMLRRSSASCAAPSFWRMPLNTRSSVEPENTDITAGGASCPPSR